jgi:simple sugar transport system permease protein
MSEAQAEKKDLGQAILKEIVPPPEEEAPRKSFWKSISIPALAILTGLLIGAVTIAATSSTVWAAFGQSIWKGFGRAFAEIGAAYQALFTGAIGDPVRIVRAWVPATREKSAQR